MVKYLLTAAAVYLGAIGLALPFAPVQFGVDAVPRDASAELVSLLRLLGGPFLDIAVLNWMSRTAELQEVRIRSYWRTLSDSASSSQRHRGSAHRRPT